MTDFNKKGIQHAGRTGFDTSNSNKPTWNRIAEAAIKKGFKNETEVYTAIQTSKQTWGNWKNKDFINASIRPIFILQLLKLLELKFEEVFVLEEEECPLS